MGQEFLNDAESDGLLRARLEIVSEYLERCSGSGDRRLACAALIAEFKRDVDLTEKFGDRIYLRLSEILGWTIGGLNREQIAKAKQVGADTALMRKMLSEIETRHPCD